MVVLQRSPQIRSFLVQSNTTAFLPFPSAAVSWQPRMDCTLSTWPSITQFDDLTWMGLGDIDPLESPQRNLDNDCQPARTSSVNADEIKAASPEADLTLDEAPAQILHTESDDFYKLTSVESLAAARWESINAVDLASVLDSFPCKNDASTSSEDVTYDLYSDGIILPEDSAFSGEVDAFMSTTMSDLSEVNKKVFRPADKDSLHNDIDMMSSDYTSLSNVQDDVRCEPSVITDEPLKSINVSASLCGSLCQMGMDDAVHSQIDCKGPNLKYVSDGGGRLQPSCFATQPVNLHVCPSSSTSTPGALDIKQSISPKQPDCIQAGMIMHWSKPASVALGPQMYSRELTAAQLCNREQVGQPNHMCIGDSYPAILDQQARMADAARVTSELKRNRAQASRARRLAASQRRAKKYPLQKLIRMSSSSAHVREKLELGTATVPHGAQQSVSQNLVNSMVPSPQLPTILPVSFQGTRINLSSSHELISHANKIKGSPKYEYHHPVKTHEETRVSPSGSSALLSQQDRQNVHELSSSPTFGAYTARVPTEALDAILLSQLQSITSKMNVDARLCIRDALYRLARSAKHRQSRTENIPGMDENERQLQAIETNTNSIDRWIVNMLFCKQPAILEDKPQPNTAQISSQSMDNMNTSSSTQQWNSCGSSVNFQPLHALTGW